MKMSPNRASRSKSQEHNRNKCTNSNCCKCRSAWASHLDNDRFCFAVQQMFKKMGLANVKELLKIEYDDISLDNLARIFIYKVFLLYYLPHC